MKNFPIRANTPKGYDPKIHIVTKFKRENYNGFYVLNLDGYYHYTGTSASALYSEYALLALSNVEVVSFKLKD